MVEIDLESDGKRVEVYPVPISTHESAYGQIRNQIGIVKSGTGPCVLLVGGNHGDEYEGQISLRNLWHKLDPKLITGTVLVIAAANLPAVEAGRRTSPLDNGNLNRAFPGINARGPTESIAAFVHALLPTCDFVLDLHSGGSSLVYVPSIIFGHAPDPVVLKKQIDAARAFGSSTILSFESLPGAMNSLSGSAIAKGIPALASELGGGGSVDVSALKMASDGLNNFLCHVGVLRSSQPQAQRARTRELIIPDASHYLHSPGDGIFEPLVDLETHIQAGELAGFLHNVHKSFETPEEIRFNSAGVVVCKSARARVKPGDCLFHTAILA
ncbi:MAG: succinylglutamate desuccinylase/aspartoacylase family protein [Hyphomicrobiales bacterium]|nr:succinylglutamate desuccinylase/aspartoacylase family protein [Hyphomicrobiales bacterium]